MSHAHAGWRGAGGSTGTALTVTVVLHGVLAFAALGVSGVTRLGSAPEILVYAVLPAPPAIASESVEVQIRPVKAMVPRLPEMPSLALVEPDAQHGIHPPATTTPNFEASVSAPAVAAVVVATTPAPATEAPRAPEAVDGVPAYLRAPQPEYPAAAREDEQQGVVTLAVLVSPEGLPAQVRLARSSGYRLLDAAAIEGVRRWMFRPARQAGRAIEAWMEIPVRFELR